MLTRDWCSSKVHEHQIYGLISLTLWNLLELIYHDCVTWDVNAVAALKGLIVSFNTRPQFEHLAVSRRNLYLLAPAYFLVGCTVHTALTISFSVSTSPGWTCFPGIAVTFRDLTLLVGWVGFILTNMLAKVSKSCMAVKTWFWPGLFMSWDFAWGIVIIGKSRLKDSSTFLSK